MLFTDPNKHATRAAWWDREHKAIEQELRTVVTTTDSAGGFLIPNDNSFMNSVQMAGAAIGGVERTARVITTPDGRPIPVPDTGSNLQTGASKAENVAVTDTTLVFGRRSLGQFMHTSGRLEATAEAMQDPGPSVPMVIGIVAAEMINRVEADRLINGTGGTNQPEGLVTGYPATADHVDFYRSHARVNQGQNGPLGLTAGATGNAVTPWVERLGQIKYLVNPFYRRSNRFSLVLNDQMDRAFATAIDNQNRPLWQDWLLGNTAKGAGIRFAGMNILSDYSIAAFAENATPGVSLVGWVGDFNWFWVRRIAGMVMISDPYTASDRMAHRWIFRPPDGRPLPLQGGAHRNDPCDRCAGAHQPGVTT